MRKSIAFCFSVVFVLSLCACSSGSASNNITDVIGSTVIENIPTEPTATQVIQPTIPAPTPKPAEEPTPTPAPTPVPTLYIPESVIYTGSGDNVISIEPPDTVYVFVITGNSASRHFAVKGYDADGNSTGLFVNTTDYYSGITVDPDQTTTTLEISANGSWEIELRSIFLMETIDIGETLTGSGDSIVGVKSYGSTATITGNVDKRYFAVKTYGTASNNLMVNTTDKYEGTVMLKGEPVIIEINAVGDWSITFNK